MTRTATATLSASWASASKRNPTLNRNCLDREVVGAATLHRYCGSGVLVSRQRERSDVLEPAQSYLLGAGFSRALSAFGERKTEAGPSTPLRSAQDDRIWVVDGLLGEVNCPTVSGDSWPSSFSK